MSSSTSSVKTPTLGEFNALVSKKMRECPEWRYGQALFNVAWEHFKDKISGGGIIGGDRDPFYNDERTPSFFCFLVDSGCFGSEETR